MLGVPKHPCAGTLLCLTLRYQTTIKPYGNTVKPHKMTTKFKQNEVTMKMSDKEFEVLVFIVNQIKMNADFSKTYYQSEVMLNESESEIFSEMVF